MEMKLSFRHVLFFQLILFLVPVTLYLIGEGAAAGIRWVLFRYQVSPLGNSLILFSKDFEYVQTGILSGKSAMSADLSFAASLLILIATAILIIAWLIEYEPLVKCSGMATMSSGFLYLMSDMIQYGVFLNGPAGFVIPVGLPVMVVVGYLVWHTEMPCREKSEECSRDLQEEEV